MKSRSIWCSILLFSFASNQALFAIGKNPNDDLVKKHINRLIHLVQSAVVPIYVEVDAGQTDQVEYANFGYGVVLQNNHVLAPLSLFSGSKSIYIQDGKGGRISAKLIGWDNGKSIAVLFCDLPLQKTAALALRDPLERYEPQEPLLILISGAGQTTSAALCTLQRIEGEQIVVSGAPSMTMVGGAIVDLHGRLAGWVCERQIFVTEGESSREALVAHSIHALKPAIDQIIQHASRPKGYLGVVVIDWPSQLGGAHIRQISVGSPAELSGLQVGDIILSINNRKVANAFDLYREMQTHAAGDTIDLRILRSYEIVSFAVILDSLKGSSLNSNLLLPVGASADRNASFKSDLIQERIRQLENEIFRLRRLLR